MRALIVEDHKELADALRDALRTRGMASDLAHSAADAELLMKAIDYSIVILDLGLPDEDGTVMLDRLRKAGCRTPVIVLTARGTIDDRVIGLGVGADDYMQKPFHVEELVARMQAVLRRVEGRAASGLTVGPLRYDPSSRQFDVDDQRIALGGREGELLELLMRRRDRVVPKASLEDQLFGIEEPPGSNAIEVYVHRLRSILKAHAPSLTIKTVRGVGYMLLSE